MSKESWDTPLVGGVLYTPAKRGVRHSSVERTLDIPGIKDVKSKVRHSYRGWNGGHSVEEESGTFLRWEECWTFLGVRMSRESWTLLEWEEWWTFNFPLWEECGTFRGLRLYRGWLDISFVGGILDIPGCPEKVGHSFSGRNAGHSSKD